MEAKTTYLWSKQISPIFSICYESDVDKGSIGEWILYAHSWPVWNRDSSTKVIFKTEEELIVFAEKAYKEYLVNQEKLDFKYMFGGRSGWRAALKFIRMYLDMKYGGVINEGT